jgi:hypothetical protein
LKKSAIFFLCHFLVLTSEWKMETEWKTGKLIGRGRNDISARRPSLVNDDGLLTMCTQSQECQSLRAQQSNPKVHSSLIHHLSSFKKELQIKFIINLIYECK